MGPEGFLDSTRYSHTFQMKKDKETKSVGKSRPRAISDTSAQPSIDGLTARVERDERDYRKRIKVVEVIFWTVLYCDGVDDLLINELHKLFTM